MPALQIKDCPTEVYERLRTCAHEENRSISQQALTAIEDFLDMRDGLKAPSEARMRTFGPSSLRQVDDTDYLTRRLDVFARINKLRPIPVTEDAPTAADVLSQIREEEAL